MAYLRKALLAVVMVAGMMTPGLAQGVPALLQQHLYAGRIADADRAFSARPAADKEAQAALGMTRFVAAIERLGQGLYRYGLRSPRNVALPGLNFPVPVNAKPEPITYGIFREMLAGFVRDLDAAQQALGAVGDAPVKLPIDVMQLRIDINGDGRAEDHERFVSLFLSMAGTPGVAAQLPTPGTFPIGFDTTDMYWLAGYANLLSVIPEFFLAHDFRDTFDTTFHLFFPDVVAPYAGMTAERSAQGIAQNYASAADALAMVHLIRWKTVEPARRASVHARLKAVVALNRKTWAAARAETDNDREWLPNPAQQGVLGIPVTEETLTSWMEFIGVVEKVLDGTLLVPHWQFTKGINLKRMLIEGSEFDLVLWLTGHGALPYLEDGPIAERDIWQRATQGLRGNLLTYAFYFN